MTPRTIRNVALAKDDEADWNYHIQVADDQNIPRFEIDPCHVVRIIDELADLSWSAEVEMIKGLVPYLKAWCIFEYDVIENGFTSGDLKTTFPVDGRL